MNQEQTQLMILRGFVASMPEADQKGVKLAAQEMREVLLKHNDHGKLALVLLAAEFAAEA